MAIYIGTTITAAILTENAFLRQTLRRRLRARGSRARLPAVERRFSLERAVRNREYRALAGLIFGAGLLTVKVMPIF